MADDEDTFVDPHTEPFHVWMEALAPDLVQNDFDQAETSLVEQDARGKSNG